MGASATAHDSDLKLAAIAAAIAEPARARMLGCLLDDRARTATELATLADIAPSTASSHLARLRTQRLIECRVQGRHRYFRLASPEVAAALEALLVLAGRPRPPFRPTTPDPLRRARTCYDHLAGSVAVALHDGLLARHWLERTTEGTDYTVTPAGERGLTGLGLALDTVRARRRRFACACLDWSERRPHLGGALGAALLDLTLARRWVRRDLDSRVVRLTAAGEQALTQHFRIRPAAAFSRTA